MLDKRPKKGHGFIYKYTSPSGKSYIGQTARTLRERAGHNGKNYKGCSLFYNAIKKFGYKNFDISILAEVKQNELDKYEIKYISIFNTLHPQGYNLTKGGAHTFARNTKKVFQYDANDGHFLREFNSAREAIAWLGADSSDSLLENCLHNKTYTQSGYCWSYLKMDKFPIHERLISPQSKKLYKYDLEGNLLEEFNSLAEAAKKYGFSRSSIKRCCRGELKTAYGFKWKCLEILAEKKYNNTAKTINQIDTQSGKVLQTFPSISAAARSLNKNTSLIRRVLNSNNTAYGYRWQSSQGSTTKDL